MNNFDLDIAFSPCQNCSHSACDFTHNLIPLDKMKELATLTRVLAMIGKAGIAGGWGALMVFSAELFPTVVR